VDDGSGRKEKSMLPQELAFRYDKLLLRQHALGFEVRELRELRREGRLLRGHGELARQHRGQRGGEHGWGVCRVRPLVAELGASYREDEVVAEAGDMLKSSPNRRSSTLPVSS
jgi:hypothetical protein